MKCESLFIKRRIEIIGIMGRAIFNCSKDCQPFLAFSESEGMKSNLTRPDIAIKDLEPYNRGCRKHVIDILGASSIVFENIIIRMSYVRSINVRQQHYQTAYMVFVTVIFYVRMG